MKTFLTLCIAVLLLSGCEDRFTGPSDKPTIEAGNKILYTRLESQLVFNNIPAGAIVQRELGSTIETVIIPAPAYLICAPQNGRMLYAQYEIPDNDTAFRWVIKLGDVDGGNVEVITVVGGLVSVLLQDAALSPDGRTVAYAITEGISSPYEPLVDRLYIYKAGSGGPVVLDSIKQTIKLDNKFSVKALLSHLAFSPDNGNYLAAAFWGEDQRIRLYNLSAKTRKLVGMRTGPFVAWSPDGTQLLFSQNSAGTYQCEPITSDGYPPIEYRVGFPHSSSLVLANMNNVTTTLVTGLLPVLDIAWSPDGSRIAYSQTRERSTLALGTDIISFPFDNPVLMDTLTSNAGDPVVQGRLQWAAGSNRLLFTQGYFSSAYIQYAMLASQICHANIKTHGNNVICSGAFGVYWLDASATHVAGPYKPANSDTLYTVPHSK